MVTCVIGGDGCRLMWKVMLVVGWLSCLGGAV